MFIPHCNIDLLRLDKEGAELRQEQGKFDPIIRL
jgi:hypothetical protein